MADATNFTSFRSTVYAFTAAVVIFVSSCGFGFTVHVADNTVSAQHIDGAQVGEPSQRFELYTVQLVAEPLAAAVPKEVHARRWVLAYRARAFGRV